MYVKTIVACRSCGGNKLDKFLDLGIQYVSDFRLDDSRPNKYPLQAVICEDCMLVQLRHTTPSQDIYHENYGFKSNISDSIKFDLMANVTSITQIKINISKWLDIASNDGTLLSFVPPSIYRVGVDPIEKYCKEAEKYADRIVNSFFSIIPFTDYELDGSARYEKFDVITSISCFYDVDRSNEFVGDVKKVLAKDGMWVIQQNYLLTTLELGAVDNFCHEHLEYYTLLSLEPLLARHGLEVMDCSTSMVNGGSIRTVVAHKGIYPVQDSVERQRTIEKDTGLDKMDIYFKFADKANKNLQDLKTVVQALKAEGKSIAILAASTRGATIWQSIGLGSKEIDCSIERNPEKVGKRFSALDIPIISEAEARERKFDYKIIGPWFFKSEIVEREREYTENGGFLIMPLPEVEIL